MQAFLRLFNWECLRAGTLLSHLKFAVFLPIIKPGDLLLRQRPLRPISLKVMLEGSFQLRQADIVSIGIEHGDKLSRVGCGLLAMTSDSVIVNLLGCRRTRDRHRSRIQYYLAPGCFQLLYCLLQVIDRKEAGNRFASVLACADRQSHAVLTDWSKIRLDLVIQAAREIISTKQCVIEFARGRRVFSGNIVSN